ncbi:MAG TPA: DUF2207 domain-containing protein [Gemmatimonadaceae bacterium]|nr:DUF2207 domain-containing protein [Gemmatimonadaceae bacterium]
MVRTSSRALFLGVALAFSLPAAGTAQDRSIRIRNFDARLEVRSDGSLDVTEHLLVGFTGQWNGLNRDLSLRHNTAQGRATRLDVDVMSVTGENRQPLRVEEETSDGGWTRRLKIWVPDASDADRSVIIRYRVANAIRFFFEGSKAGALDELYWNVTGKDWTMPIDSVHAHVVLPEAITPTQHSVYTGASGSVATDATVDATANEVDFTLTRPLAPHEGMTVGVGWPAGSISSRPTETEERMAALFRWSPLLLPVVVFLLAFSAWQKRGRDPKEGSYVVRFEPVEGVSPAELGTLMDNTAHLRDIISTLVDLAVRGFVRIEELEVSQLLGLSKSTDYEIHLLRQRPKWIGLKVHEERFLEALTKASKDGYSVKVSALRNKFYKSLPKIRDAIYLSLVSKGYYLDRPDRVKQKWIVLALATAAAGAGLSTVAAAKLGGAISPVAVAAAAAVSAVVLLVFALIMPARTIAGARAREATLGFEEFLGRVESDRYDRMITSPEMFERFLPYAMAFGIEDRWARAFEQIYREPPKWYTSNRGHFNVADLASSMSRMSSAAASSMSSSPSSSGSGGGGSSGGGSGGGGGSGF